jgi:hypothetical protein
MSRERAEQEERIRATVERAFLSWDAALDRDGRPDLKTHVSSVELRGSYPDTCLVIHSKDADGTPLVRVDALWAEDSLDWDDHGSPLLLIDEYLGG